MSLDLEPIKARIARATPGPWRVKEADSRSIHRGTVQVEENGRVIETVAECYCGGYEGHGLRNAELVANAPTDLDALVAEVERLREEVAGLRDVHAMMGAVAHADAHLAAMEDFAVTKERNGVVAFLHGQAEMAYDNSDAHHALCLAAESIERGEHRREEKP